MNFSERLKQLRKKNNLSQEGLAKKLGLARSTIAGYETPDKKREPDYETLKKLADFFDVSIDYLLGREYYPKNLDLSMVLKESSVTYKGKPITEDQKKTIELALEDGDDDPDIEDLQIAANNENINLEEDKELHEIIKRVIKEVRKERGYKPGKWGVLSGQAF